MFGALKVSVFLSLLPPLCARAGEVKLGIDVLEEENFAALEGKRVGLVANPASVDSKLVGTVEILRKTDQCKLAALFGPEHGVYGDEYAGVKINDRKDPGNLPIYSLYGDKRKPTPAMLSGLDTLVFDLQDIGSRSYTYISTMKLCLEACAENGVEFVALDRPNPLGGERIEGPMMEKDFESFVGLLSVPYLHGMTMGELAQWVKEEIAPHYDKLKVIKMKGWNRNMLWEDTGLRWVPTSPHIPEASTCAYYAATGIMGELTDISCGVGYTLPFHLIGAPGLKADALADLLNTGGSQPDLRGKLDPDKTALNPDSPVFPHEGILFRPARFKPFYGAFKDQPCEGAQIYLDPKKAENLVEINFRALWGLDAPLLFKRSAPSEIAMFDKVCGTDEPRKWLMEGRDMNALFDRWKAACEKFREIRKRYLLYD